MLFLIDSNVAIASDPLSHDIEPGAQAVLHLMRLISKHGHSLRTHPASRTDFARISDPALRLARLTIFEKFEPLAAPPEPGPDQRNLLGTPPSGTNDAVDHALMAAVVANAVFYLVTDDQGIHRKARRLGIDDRVVTAVDAVALLRALHVDLPSPPPAVASVVAHQLNINDPIFDGLEDDYPGFTDWLVNVSRAQRDALLIGDNDAHAAIAILKREPDGEYGLPKGQLKISTFKVSDEHSGQKYGELLLKAIFERANNQRDAGIYVTVFEKQAALLALLTDFGFEAVPGTRTSSGELVMAKPLREPIAPGLDALQQHVRYGPPFLPAKGRHFAVPVEPQWHRMLFPDAEPPDEEALFAFTPGLTLRPHGNALRKAYLCRSQSRLLRPGDVLLFYRSRDEKAVHVIGVCERTFVSRDPSEIAAAVGKRTVYSLRDIETMTSDGPVLVVMLRQDRVLRTSPIKFDELRAARALTSWPQSITQIRAEGASWLRQRLDE